ncbi:methyl-CpG-binding domain protein 5-like [Hypomesus transpacificus]|uniref:methyl-CpG-binding domain protein 5-like n=1 Tax=Hypomesus transpacificus TaxID=137520 RepID=UPI001F0824A2|nr:methyl-CpG-binding domain protein 5-like [Hypomesus transpacificus]
MDRTMKYEGQYEGLCGEGRRPPAQVPIGWQRKTHHNGVVYISPSGSVLACLEQVKSYLLTDGTCKCGLECPLIIHKIFNFDPGAAVKQRTAEDARADADVTKLCIHKRKIIAVATLHRSMESPHLVSGGTGTAPMGPMSHQAIRNNMHNGPPNSVAADSKNPYKMSMSSQRYYQHELGSSPQRDPYLCHSRARLGGGGGDHNSQRSPYRSRQGVLLSPPSSTSCGSQHYGDGTPSPRTDSLRSPDRSILGFHGTLSPGSAHVNGERFTPLSPPGILLHGSPSAVQPSCAMAGRTNGPLSPTINAKSPNMQRSPCSFSHNMDYQHQPQSHPSLSQLPPCILQKNQVTSEKDPLGILDPIPSKAPSRDPSLLNPPGVHSAQPQVPSMNVNIPPSIVPLPSNLPLPTAKSGPVVHGQRVQHPPASSVSSSPIVSPVHMAGPGLARVEESPHRSRCSSASSEHGGYALSSGLQASCGGSKLPPRSPRPSLPPSSAYKQDQLHHLKDGANQLLGGMNSSLSRHPGSMCPPVSGSEGALHSNHQGGMPLNQLLEQQNPSSFPASSLLSAAAKAQLVNQNKLTDGTAGAEVRPSGLGHPGLVGGGRGGNHDGHGTLNPRYVPNTGPLSTEVQSGRAALRDKLMAQQREAHRKRKQPSDGGEDVSFNMLKHPMSGAGSSTSGYSEPMRRALQPGGLAPNTSMAQLLQSMSNQNAHKGPNHVGHHPARSGKSPFFEESVPQMSALQMLQRPNQHQGRTEISSCQNFNSEGYCGGQDPGMEHFPGLINQIHDPAMAGSFGPLGYGGHEVVSSVGSSVPHRQQFGHFQKPSQGNLHFRDRTGLPPMMSNGGQTFPESGEGRSLSCDLRQAQEDSLQSLLRTSHALQLGQSAAQGQPAAQGQSAAQGHPSNPMDSLLQNFQVGLPERVPLPNRTVISRPGVMFSTGAPLNSQQEYQSAQGLLSSEANYRAPAGMASKTTSSVITSMARVGVYTDSVPGEPVNLSQGATHSVIHGPLRSYPQEAERRPSRVGRPRKNPDKTSTSPAAVGAPVRLRAPRRGTQRRPAVREAEARQGLWCSEELLQQSSLDLHRNGSYLERPKGYPNPGDPALSQFNGMYSRPGLVTHMNGGAMSPGRAHPKHIQPPGGFSSPEGHFVKDYSHYNGHLNGHPNGHYNGHYNGQLNGHCALSAPGIQSSGSEEDPGPVDPLFSTRGLHQKPRSHPAGDLLWGQGKGFPPWPGKPREEGHIYLPGVLNSIQDKVEAERFHRTLAEDLEALHKAKMHRNGMELNNHLEAAIQDAMTELDKLTGNLSQRDRQAKTPKPKRRKISR